MGKSLLEKIYNNEDYSIHYINRNKNYWNNEIKTIKNLNFAYGDRDESDDFTKLLLYLSE